MTLRQILEEQRKERESINRDVEDYLKAFSKAIDEAIRRKL